MEVKKKPIAQVRVALGWLTRIRAYTLYIDTEPPSSSNIKHYPRTMLSTCVSLVGIIMVPLRSLPVALLHIPAIHEEEARTLLSI